MDTLASFFPDGIGLLGGGLLIVASFFTSALTAAFGVGGGIAMLALLGLFIPVSALIPIHGAIQVGSNTGRAWQQRAHIVHSIALPFIAGSFVGALLGAFFVVQLPDAFLKLVLGVFVIMVTWAKMPGMAKLSHAGLVIGSAILAVLSMFVGATGPLLSSFLAQLIPDNRKALIATHAAGMTVQHTLKVIVFAVAGFAFGQWLPFILLMVVSGYLGTVYGTSLLEKLPEESFRRWFKIGLTLLALNLVREGVMGLF